MKTWKEAGTMGPLMDTAYLELSRLGQGNTSAALPSFMVSKKRRNHREHIVAQPGLVGQPQDTAGRLG